MNDFTKKELLELKFVLEQWCYPKDKYPNSESLLKKIQSMIDNYPKPCEHKWNNMAYSYLQCEKCFSRQGMNE